MFKLEEKADPGQTALIVVDVQNDFCHSGGALACRGKNVGLIQGMVPNLVDFISQARGFGVPIVFVRAEHGDWTDSPLRRARSEDPAVKGYPVCSEGSWGAEFYRVEPQPKDKIVVKHRYGAFYGTDLDVALRAKGIKTLIMTGVVTNVCVETTAREGFQRDYNVVFVDDCCGANSVEDHAATLKTIGEYFGVVARAKDVVEVWRKLGGS